MRKISTLIIVLLATVTCDKVQLPPKRPASVPESATWGGGVDGGSWLFCQRKDGKQAYACEIYWDSDGTLRAKGTYLLREARWVEERHRATYTEVQQPPEVVFSSFDGLIIHLQGKLVLVPQGTIEYPFGDGHGKRQRYEAGKPVGAETEY